MPREVFDDGDFQVGLAKFLSSGKVVDSEGTLPPPVHPQYINALFIGILRSVGRADHPPRLRKRAVPLSDVLGSIGRTVGVSRVTKHVHDHISNVNGKSFRRSLLWLFIRVAIQMSDNPALGRSSYKSFMLFFMCTLARDESNTTLSGHLLHLMSSTILRRLNKLGSSTPNWLSETALDTYACLREILDAIWKQLGIRRSPFQNPSHDELVRDTQLSLLNSREYICKALENYGRESVHSPFCPNHRYRGTIQDFLSSDGTFFDMAYEADPDTALYDVKRSVEEGIDEWVACVINVDDACAQLAILMKKYTSNYVKFQPQAEDDPREPTSTGTDPERASIMILTGIELYVALDKLVVKQIPLLADYPPLIQMEVAEDLHVRKTTSLHRLSRALQYLSARHSQSRFKLSVLSDEFTKDSFPVRYYDQSPHLQQLKAQIQEDAVKNATPSARVPHSRHLAESTEVSRSLLPASSLLAKVVVFELQRPACFSFWRHSALCVSHLLECDEFSGYVSGEERHRWHLLEDVSALQPYLVEHSEDGIHLAYFYPESSLSRNHLELHYVRNGSRSLYTQKQYSWHRSQVNKLRYDLRYHCPSCGVIEKYVHSTSHTSNDVMSAQANCPADLSLDEFVAFAHLRSGGSLQWLNILHGLHTRTLNLRRHQVHFLLSYAVSQVGPFDFNTGTWIWHRELQDPSFCITLLGELERLLVDVGASSMDSVLMNTISLLLTRVLASSPSDDVSERVIVLIRSVRRKTFSCVQDLSYDLAMAPANKERRNLLLEMAATCRSTFDVDHITHSKLLHSPEDVDALLSCSFFIRAFYPAGMSYS